MDPPSQFADAREGATNQIQYDDELRTVQEHPSTDIHQLSILNCYGSFGTPNQVVVGASQVLHDSTAAEAARAKVAPELHYGGLGMRLPVRRPQISPRSETGVSEDSGIVSEARDDVSLSPAAISVSVSPPARYSQTPHSIIRGEPFSGDQQQYTEHSETKATLHHDNGMGKEYVPQDGGETGFSCSAQYDEPIQGPSQTIEIVPEPSMMETRESESMDIPIKEEIDPVSPDQQLHGAGNILGTISVLGNNTNTGVSTRQTPDEKTSSQGLSAGNVLIKEEPLDEPEMASFHVTFSSEHVHPMYSGGHHPINQSSTAKPRVVKCRGVKVMTSFPRKRTNVSNDVVNEEKRRKLTVSVEDFLKVRLDAISKSKGRKKMAPKKLLQKPKAPKKKSASIQLKPAATSRSKPNTKKTSPKVVSSKKKQQPAPPAKSKPARQKKSPKKEKQSPKKPPPPEPIVIQPVPELRQEAPPGVDTDYHVRRRKFRLPPNKTLEKITMNLPGNTRDFIEEYQAVKPKSSDARPMLDEHTKKIVDAVLHNPKNERFKKSLSNFKKGIFLCQVCNKRCRNRKAYVRHQKDHAGAIDVYLPYITKGIGPVNQMGRGRGGGKPPRTLDDVSSGDSEDEENYECKVCGKVLQSKRTYRHHKTIHQRIDPTDLPRCRLCGTFFTKMTSLHHHLRTAHYVCWQCGERRKSAKDLNAHRKTAHSALCEICGMSCVSPKALTQHAAYHFLVAGPKEFKTKYQIRKERWQTEGAPEPRMPPVEADEEHAATSGKGAESSSSSTTPTLKSEEDKSRPYLCKCRRRLKTWDSFQAHSMIHRGLKPYSCPVCKKGFLSSSSRKTHVRHVHSDDRPYRCVYCDEKFKSSSSRDVHTRLHHTKEKPHKCDECGMDFSLTSSLKSHKQAKHSVKPDYSCKVCQREFKLPGTLAIHMRQHTGEKPYVCGQCGKAFRQGSHLRTHVRTHSDERLYPCQICHKSFTQSSHLNTHMKIHQDSKEHKCEYCGKGFNLANTLKTHLRIHTGEKPFKCSICDRSFNQSSARNSHEKCHSDEKPLGCEICGARFKLKGTLKTHMLVHSKELPYKCTRCEKAFTTSSSLKLHVNTKHENNLKFACSHCSKRFVAKHLLDRHEVTHVDASCECDKCGKSMKNKFTLKSHMKKYHSE